VSIESAPAEFVNALNHALTILSWQENLISEEIPPFWMWHLDWEISAWFDNVKRKRDAKYGGASIDDDSESKENALFDDFKKDLTG